MRLWIRVWCSNQRNSTDLNEEMSFLQLSILQLMSFVGIIQHTHQLIHLKKVILTLRSKYRQKIRISLLTFSVCLQSSPVHVQTQVWKHGILQAVSKGGCCVMKFDQRVKTLLLGCLLHGCAQAHGDGRHHGPQGLDQQHCHHLVRVPKHLQEFKITGKCQLSLQRTFFSTVVRLTWLLHWS